VTSEPHSTGQQTVTSNEDAIDVLGRLVDQALAKGADAADGVVVDKRSLAVTCRLGHKETLERSAGVDVGLRVFVGQRQSLVSSSDLSSTALAQLVERAIAMAQCVPEDPFCGLAAVEQIARNVADIDGYCHVEPSVTDLEERAVAAEDAARQVSGVMNSEGAEASWGIDDIAMVASNGFAQSFRRSWNALSVSVLAGEGTAMERDYDYAVAVFPEDLPALPVLGRSAGERAVRRMGPRKVDTAQVPIIYEPRTSRSLLGHFAGAISGESVNRGTTFLKDKLGKRIFPESVDIIDDPLRRRGLRSRPFDGEGIAAEALLLIQEGVLQHWLLDLRSARQMGSQTTGRASRGAGSLPSPSATNLSMSPGEHSAQQLIADVKQGFYVTELIGHGVNAVTGDYSRGASGYWIDHGELSYPVSEVTVSGNLLDIFAHVTPADDLTYRYGIDAPTVRIDGMTVAGR